MKTVKNVFGWVVYGCVCLIKLPFSIINAFLAPIEFLLGCLTVRILRLIGSETAVDAIYAGARVNSEHAGNIADFWDDIAEEEL